MYVVQWQEGMHRKKPFYTKKWVFPTGQTHLQPGRHGAFSNPQKKRKKNLLWGNILDIKKITTNFSVVYVWFFLACIII